MRARLVVRLLPCLTLAAGVVGAAHAASPGSACETAASKALRTCVKKLGRLEQRCYRDTGQTCLGTDPKVAKVFDGLGKTVLAKCPDQATVTAALYPPALTPAGLVGRLDDACEAAVDALVARSFGGPQAAVRTPASPTDQKCLDNAYARSLSLLTYELGRQSKCIRTANAGKICDAAAIAAKLAKKEASTATQIGGRCSAAIETLVAIDAGSFVARAAAQSRCLVAAAHGATAPLTLDCGPRASVPVPARGLNTQIVLDNATWGSRCGDGSDYAFWIRLAPASAPLDKVVVFLQGGGACYDGPGCAAQPPARFNSLADTMPGGGIFSPSNAANPFRDWTIVFLPYCTQDLHIGGGVANVFPEITVERYGALNTRAAIRYARDVLWAALDAADAEGYRGTRMTTVLTGGSAGAYGAVYNYHWVLDDLGWKRTTAAPDAGLGMDNGQPLGVIALGALALLPAPGWASQPYVPPYCFTPSCAESFDNLQVATVPRLKVLPEQQVLNIANQIDNVQRNTTLFADTATFVNTLRSNYCAVQGSPGLRAFFSAITATTHGQLNGNTFYNTVVGGTSLATWLGAAMSDPDGVVDKVATGTLETDYPGVAPFPCVVGSPSGAFLD